MRILIVFVLLFSFIVAFGQDDQFIKKHWFDGGNICSQKLSPNQLFIREFPNPDDIWRASCVLTANAVGICRKTGMSVETKDVYLGVSYVDLVYTKGTQVENIFNSLYDYMKNENKDWNANLSMFCKPGKVFCLSKDKLSIRVISMNTCANMK